MPCAFWFLSIFSDAQPRGGGGDVPNGHRILHQLLNNGDKTSVDEFVKIVCEFKRPEVLFSVAASQQNWPLINGGLLKIAQDDELRGVLFKSESVLSHWQTLSAIFDRFKMRPSPFDALLVKLDKQDELVSKTMQLPNGFESGTSPLYRRLLALDELDFRTFGEWCKAELSGWNRGQWSRAFKDAQGSFLLLLLDLQQHCEPFSLDTAYVDALGDHAELTIEENITPADETRSQWVQLPSLAAEHLRSGLTRRLLVTAMNCDGKIPGIFFAFYGEAPSDAAQLANEPKLLSHLFSPILRERNIAGLEWIKKVVMANPSILAQQDRKDRDAFLARLGELTKDGEDALCSLAGAIKKCLAKRRK